MKHPIVLGVAVCVASLLRADQTIVRMEDQLVHVTTEEATDDPQALSQSVLARIYQEGWNDVIYDYSTPDRAYLFYTQRSFKGVAVTQVRVTLWKATKANGRTSVETWVCVLDHSEANPFLDEKFARVAARFKAGTH